jgi:hypothetical protein
LQIYLWSLKYSTSFLAPLPGNGGYILFGHSSPLYLFLFFDSISTPAIHGVAIHSTALYTKGRVLWATAIFKTNPFIWLRTSSWLYSHGSESTLLRRN